jgi:hypothetical protein
MVLKTGGHDDDDDDDDGEPKDFAHHCITAECFTCRKHLLLLNRPPSTFARHF